MLPRIETLPETVAVPGSRPNRDRSKTLLPLPDSPTMASTSPGWTDSETPRTARVVRAIVARTRRSSCPPTGTAAGCRHVLVGTPPDAPGSASSFRKAAMRHARVFVLGRRKELFGRSFLNDHARAHHGGPVTKIADHVAIVRDQHHGQAQISTELGQQAENLRLHGLCRAPRPPVGKGTKSRVRARSLARG